MSAQCPGANHTREADQRPPGTRDTASPTPRGPPAAEAAASPAKSSRTAKLTGADPASAKLSMARRSRRTSAPKVSVRRMCQGQALPSPPHESVTDGSLFESSMSVSRQRPLGEAPCGAAASSIEGQRRGIEPSPASRPSARCQDRRQPLRRSTNASAPDGWRIRAAGPQPPERMTSISASSSQSCHRWFSEAPPDPRVAPSFPPPAAVMKVPEEAEPHSAAGREPVNANLICCISARRPSSVISTLIGSDFRSDVLAASLADCEGPPSPEAAVTVRLLGGDAPGGGRGATTHVAMARGAACAEDGGVVCTTAEGAGSPPAVAGAGTEAEAAGADASEGDESVRVGTCKPCISRTCALSRLSTFCCSCMLESSIFSVSPKASAFWRSSCV
mmetsp:Transcript_45284/g.145139  ORF Transcript_45284/g.145139 Transcript_45284/m.145139 type:complete len:390 (-) Transcript_45284:739-1908(-)